MEQADSTWCSTAALHPKQRRSLWRKILCLKGGEDSRGEKTGWWRRTVGLFDLDLLGDAVFLSICVGVSVAFTAEINFTMLTPLILDDRGFSIEHTARFMSVTAVTDLIFRFLAPFIGHWLRWSIRTVYSMALVLVIISRTVLAVCEGYVQTIWACALVGVARGLRTVYMPLVIPNYVPLDKLASATSLQSLLNGLLFILGGPIIGHMRDVLGNFNACIYLMNALTLSTLVLWSAEFTIRRCNKEKHLPATSP